LKKLVFAKVKKLQRVRRAKLLLLLSRVQKLT
jgi:hypothetical protein